MGPESQEELDNEMKVIKIVTEEIELLVLLDKTILTNFALVGLTPILRELWGKRVATTEEVLDEYAAGVETGKLPRVDWTPFKIIALSSQEKVLAIGRFPKLGRGERSCLIVAIERDAMLVTDDQLARAGGTISRD